MASLTRRQLFGGLAASAALQAQRSRQPNFVIILADDLGIGDLGCFGAGDVQTPHINRLAANGIRFTDWHAGSPVCSPSRASLLTGKYPQRCGIPQILFSKPGSQVPGLRKSEITLPGELRKQGYRTAAIGKWHLGTTPESRPLSQGFDHFFGYYSGWIDYYSHRFYTLGGDPIFHDLWRDDKEVWADTQYQTELLTREATAFLKAQRADQPFFLYLAYGAPHYPMMAPEKYLNRFPASMDRDRRMHAAMVAALDDAVGAVRTALHAKGLEKNTCIFFMSDNGATHEIRADHAARPYEGGSNRPYRGWKGSLFEGGMRVPAIMTWPGMLKPKTIDSPGTAMDILPTFLKWVGISQPSGLDGIDISGSLKNEAAWPDAKLFWDYDGQAAVRSGKWKYLTGYREALGLPLSNTPWLSDLSTDPGEHRNVIEEHPDVAAALRKAVADWRSTLQT